MLMQFFALSKIRQLIPNPKFQIQDDDDDEILDDDQDESDVDLPNNEVNEVAVAEEESLEY